MDSNIKQMVVAIKAGNTSEAKSLFETAMKSKLNAALDERKVSVAGQIYGSK